MSSKSQPQNNAEQLFSSTFICGGPRSGKTNHAMNIARTLMANNVILFIIDPTKTWVNFSSPKSQNIVAVSMSKDMVSKSHVKLPSIDWNKHYIFDTSQLGARKQRRFIEQFCRDIMNVATESSDTQPKRMVIVEECHTPLPPFSTRSKEAGDALRMLTHGRHFGIEFMAITQFPTTCDSNLIKAAQHRYFFRLERKDDIARAAEFVGHDNARDLPKLLLGECFYACPYSFEIKRMTTPKFMEAPPPIPSKEAVKQEEKLKKKFPELLESILKCPMKMEKNNRRDDEYLFHIFPFGELGSLVGYSLIKEIVEGLTEKIREFGNSFDYIACLGTGDKWATLIAIELGVDVNRIPERETGLPSEKHVHLQTLLYDKDLYFRDFKAGDKVIIIDDVISTGETMATIVKTLRKMGVTVMAVFCIAVKGLGYRKIEELGILVKFLIRIA